MADIFGTIVGAGANIALGALNNIWAEQQQAEARRQNYMYGEMAANNADRRTRALYNDFYSPKALLEQYREAGLSPSLMFGGTPGQGGQSGAMGTGAAGLGTPFMPMTMLEGAQIANIAADTAKKKEETKNISKDTEIKEFERQMSEMTTSQYKTEWEIINTEWVNPTTGEQTSLFEAAENHYTFDSFLEAVRKDETTGDINYIVSTEAGMKTLRAIYEASNKFHRDIAILSNEEINAHFQTSVLNALEKMDYATINADTAIQQLKAVKATSELTQTQKDAWNNLIDRLGKKGSTTRDIVVVIGMILSNFASHTGIKINTGK